MIHDQVDKYADAALLAAVRELDEVSERAVAGIDTVVIRDIVPVVSTWRRLKRH